MCGSHVHDDDLNHGTDQDHRQQKTEPFLTTFIAPEVGHHGFFARNEHSDVGATNSDYVSISRRPPKHKTDIKPAEAIEHLHISDVFSLNTVRIQEPEPFA